MVPGQICSYGGEWGGTSHDMIWALYRHNVDTVWISYGRNMDIIWTKTDIMRTESLSVPQEASHPVTGRRGGDGL